MGVTSSSLVNLKHNDHLKKLAGKDSISYKDNKYWDELLSFAFNNSPKTCEESKVLEDAIHPLLESISEGNPTSLNVGTLVKIFLHKASQLKSLSIQDSRYSLCLWQTFNCLHILKLITKHFIETLSEENVLRQFISRVNISEGKSFDETGSHNFELLVNALVEILVDVPLESSTYFLHVETMNMLIVSLSIQMYSAKPAQNSIIFKCFMHKKCAIHALLLTKCLLTNFIKQEPTPINEGGSIILGLASGIWNALTLGKYSKPENADNEAYLARQSLLLLLILTNHCTLDRNPYREALFTCHDMHNQDGGDHAVTGFKIDYPKVYSVLCSSQNDEQTTLLLYLLLHRNPSFRSFVLSRAADLDSLLVPILKILYSSPERSSHHIYMALIILLILSEDNLFNSSIHEIVLKKVIWYKEKQLTEISLGGLIILVIIRTIQFNIMRTRDKFLHTNLLATLANMSNHFKGLNPYVCQKLIGLFGKLAKKFNKSLGQLHQSYNGTFVTQSEHGSDQDTDIMGSPDLVHDISIYEEVLRMILEIINACLAAQLTHNPNLVYTLLYNRKIFEPFHAHPSFQDIVMNIETVLTYFANRIQSLDKQLSVQEVYEIIEHSSLKWPSDKLKKFPELRFRYVEDAEPEEFFIPYIWSLVYRSSGIYFNSQNILLFNPHRNVV